MQPPYFGYFNIGRKSTASTFEECLQQFDGDLESFSPIKYFNHFYHAEEGADYFYDNEHFKLFHPEGEKHEIYIFVGEPVDDTFTLRNGNEYYFGIFTDIICPTDRKSDAPVLEFSDIIEEEFDHLSANYPHLFKKITVEEFQVMLDNYDYPLVVCAK